jgi:hypothetical protein
MLPVIEVFGTIMFMHPHSGMQRRLTNSVRFITLTFYQEACGSSNFDYPPGVVHIVAAKLSKSLSAIRVGEDYLVCWLEGILDMLTTATNKQE